MKINLKRILPCTLISCMLLSNTASFAGKETTETLKPIKKSVSTKLTKEELTKLFPEGIKMDNTKVNVTNDDPKVLQSVLEKSINNPKSITTQTDTLTTPGRINDLSPTSTSSTNPSTNANSLITPMWGTGGKENTGTNTHKFIVNQGITQLNNNFPTAANFLYETFQAPEITGNNINLVSGASSILYYSWKTDDLEMDPSLTGVSSLLMKGHFYGADGTNTAGEKNPTAKSRFTSHYLSAVSNYKNNNKPKAYKELGMALHYMSDLSNPHHVTNKTIVDSRHSDFESFVDSNCSLLAYDGNYNQYYYYAVNNGTYDTYNYVLFNTTDKIADDTATYARQYINFAESTDTSNMQAAMEPTLALAQRNASALLYKFYYEVNKYSSITTQTATYGLTSPNPYANNTSLSWTIKKEGAAKIRVRFSYIDTESGYDFVNTSAGDRISGSYTSRWSSWSTGSNINIMLTSDGRTVKKGFKIDMIEYLPAINIVGNQLASLNVASAHPYASNSNLKWTISRPGAKRLRVRFLYIDTEGNYDYVKTSAGRSISMPAGTLPSDPFTGWTAGKWSYYSFGSSINVTLTSDGSTQYNGFKIDMIEFQQ